MDIGNVKRENREPKPMKRLLLKFVIILTFGVIFSVAMHDVWVRHLELYHTVLELICIFIALSIFISIWFAHGKRFTSNSILGFGYLAVAIFDILHTFYYLKLSLLPHAYFDLSTRYWILGRLTEAIVLLLVVRSTRWDVNRGVSLCTTLTVMVGISYFVNGYHEYLPVLLTEEGVTLTKIALEYVVITIYMITLFLLKDKAKHQTTAYHPYIFMALLLAIPSEFLFTLYSSVDSMIWTLGHMLKILSYFFLFRGVFVNTVTYPYEKLEDEHKQLDKLHNETSQMTAVLNDILDALPLAVQKYDCEGKLRFVNKEFGQMAACNRKQLYGFTQKELLDIFPTVGQENSVIKNKTFNNGKEVKKGVWTFINLRGENINVSVTSQRITDGWLVLLKDTKKEQELQNIHLQTETILDSVNNCVLMIDQNKKVVLCNKALEELFEMKREEIIGMDIDALNEKICFGAKELPDLGLTGDVEKQAYEVSLTSMKGNKKELLLYLSSIKNIHGEIIGAISVSTDISELKEEQKKMIQQEKLALLGQMGAGIVHETRNFLTTIKGRCQLIGGIAQNEMIKQHAAKINHNIDEVNRIISEFLFLSKPREAELDEVSLYDVFRSIKSMVEASSLVKGVNVDFQLSNEERYLICDEGQIKQVILNICKNAVDAMAGISDSKLKVQTGFFEESNEMFIRIEDNGRGMSQEQISKIGTPFFTTKKTGTGLGLNICYQIISQHKGTIEVESEIGKGTTFTVRLPCIADDEFNQAV